MGVSDQTVSGNQAANQESPYIHSSGQWAARSILAGFFVAPIEALPEVSVTDVVSPSLYNSQEKSLTLIVLHT